MTLYKPIDVKNLPPRHEQNQFSDFSIDVVLIKDGKDIGYGFYDFQYKRWWSSGRVVTPDHYLAPVNEGYLRRLCEACYNAGHNRGWHKNKCGEPGRFILPELIDKFLNNKL